MAVTVQLSPTYPLPGVPFTAVFSCTATGTYVRVFVTNAPTGSGWKKRLTDEARTQIQVVQADAGDRVELTSFDRPGKYVCTLQEILKVSPTTAAYEDDPNGNPTETVIGETPYSFVIGQKLTAGLTIGEATGTLALWCWDGNIRETTVPLHGEATPEITDPSDRMQTAIESSAVQTALAALVGTATTVCGAPGTSLDDLISNYNSHRTQSGVHASNDTDNTVDSDYTDTEDLDGLSQAIQELETKLRRHITNDDGSGTGVGSAGYHTDVDWPSLPLITSAGDMLQAGLAIASLWLAYFTHGAQGSPVHVTADATNVPTALPALMELYRQIEAIVKTNNPTAPATESSATTLLVSRGGMSKA